MDATDCSPEHGSVPALFTGIFQATAQGTAAFMMSIIQGITLIPVLYIANQMNGFHGVVWSLVIADAVAFLVGAVMLYALRNKLQPDLESLVQWNRYTAAS